MIEGTENCSPQLFTAVQCCNSYEERNLNYPLLNSTREVDDRHILCWNTERHASQLARKVRDDLGDGLSSTSGRWNYVHGSRATTAPVLVAGSVDGLLSGSVRVNSSHQTLDDVVLLVNHFDQRRKAVRSARSIAAYSNVTSDNDKEGLGLYIDVE